MVDLAFQGVYSGVVDIDLDISCVWIVAVNSRLVEEGVVEDDFQGFIVDEVNASDLLMGDTEFLSHIVILPDLDIYLCVGQVPYSEIR